VLRVLADRRPLAARFLVLGSASPDLLQQASESLAGRIGFGFTRTTAPSMTPSIRSALQDLGLSRLDVVHAGRDTFPLAPKVRAVALGRLLQDLSRLRR
jgi:hypothetical protein